MELGGEKMRARRREGSPSDSRAVDALFYLSGGGLGLHGREGGDSCCLHQLGVVYRFSSSICQTLTLPRNTPYNAEEN